MAMLLGKKVGMTRTYDDQGRLLPVTVIQAGPCAVMQIKTVETDGYNAVQLGFNDTKPSRTTQAAQGHAKKANTTAKSFIREMRLAADAKTEYKIGDSITVSAFAQIKEVDVAGRSKGKGFAGPMKRHHFGGMPGSHGTERKHRSPGTQASWGTNRGHGGNIKKGKKMGGHMGDCNVTSKNHILVGIDETKNLLIVKGAIPGAAGSYVVVRSSPSAK